MTIAVHLRSLPVRLADRSQEHFQGLLREFELIAGGTGQDEGSSKVPARLMDLVTSITTAYSGINNDAHQRLNDAIDRREEVIPDHVLVVPRTAGPAAKALQDIVEEGDEYCRQGSHLLTLATPPDLVAYRRWYLGQILGQLDGQPAIPWPDSPEAKGLT
jgi:hypothetical protein